MTPAEDDSYTACRVFGEDKELLLGPSIALPGVVFVLGAAAIIVAGTRLPVLAKAAAPRFGISDTALGLFVLAVITSMPELAVTLSAMVGQRAPDMALGNILGSNNFNLAVLAILSLAFSGRGFLSSVDRTRYEPATIMLLLFTALAGAGVVFGGRLGSVAPVFLFSLPVAIAFIREVIVRGEAPSDEPVPGATGAAGSGTSVLPFVLVGALVVMAGVLVSWAGKRIADYPFGGTLRLGETFVGTILIAVATSLPEVTVAFAAMHRAGSRDMALGTILGSNSFNLLVFAIGAPLLMIRTTPPVSAWSNLSSVNLINVAAGLALTGLALGAMRLWRHGSWSATLTTILAPVYLVSLYCVWALGTP